MEEMSLLATSWKEKVEKLEKTGQWKLKIVVKLTVCRGFQFDVYSLLFSRVRKFTRFHLSAYLQVSIDTAGKPGEQCERMKKKKKRKKKRSWCGRGGRKMVGNEV
jgi:hypothetical protein